MNHNDLLNWHQRLKAKDPDGARWLETQRAQRVSEGVRAKTVVDHPGWQLLLEKIGEQIDQTQAARDAAASALLHDDSMKDDATFRLRIKQLDGALGAFSLVLSIIPTIIRDAARAAASEEL